jgi:DMSO/TMAO reductase YedYZ molybdopterin-dependent catalytic subunit
MMGNNKTFRLLPLALLILVFLLTSCSGEIAELSAANAPQSETTAAVTPGKTTTAIAPSETPASITPKATNIADYRLIVDGLVDNPLSLTYDSLQQYPAVSEKLWLVCPGAFETTNEWTGVPVSLILDQAGTKPEASKVNFIATDGYSNELSMEDARKDGAFLAYYVEGKVLPEADGYPLRLVVKDQIGAVWVRYLVHIEVK